MVTQDNTERDVLVRMVVFFLKVKVTVLLWQTPNPVYLTDVGLFTEGPFDSYVIPS